MALQTGHKIAILSFLALLLLTVVSSALPDGLEWAAEKLGFLGRERTILTTPLADYSLSVHLPPLINKIISGLLGAGLVFGIIYFIFGKSKK
jgi:hypothetical protein